MDELSAALTSYALRKEATFGTKRIASPSMPSPTPSSSTALRGRDASELGFKVGPHGQKGKPQVGFRVKPYLEERDFWPKDGRVVLAQFTERTSRDEGAILVYAAFDIDIVNYAFKHQTFRWAEKETGWDPNRMSWVKTNFLWMQYRSGWGSKEHQHGTVGLWLKRSLFEDMLENSMGAFHYSRLQTKKDWEQDKAAKRKGAGDRVVLQWDPDHHPSGEPIRQRRAVQLGLKGHWRDRVFDNSRGELLGVLDLTEFVQTQSGNVCKDSQQALLVPTESAYPVPQNISDDIGEGPFPDDD